MSLKYLRLLFQGGSKSRSAEAAKAATTSEPQRFIFWRKMGRENTAGFGMGLAGPSCEVLSLHCFVFGNHQ